MFRPTKELNDLWRIKTNEELDELIQRKYITRFIKSQRLKWLGHVERMPKEREGTIICKWKPLASKPIERSKKRWEDDVRKDLQTMKIKNWKKMY
jgi:hypothetical protein